VDYAHVRNGLRVPRPSSRLQIPFCIPSGAGHSGPLLIILRWFCALRFPGCLVEIAGDGPPRSSIAVPLGIPLYSPHLWCTICSPLRATRPHALAIRPVLSNDPPSGLASLHSCLPRASLPLSLRIPPAVTDRAKLIEFYNRVHPRVRVWEQC